MSVFPFTLTGYHHSISRSSPVSMLVQTLLCGEPIQHHHPRLLQHTLRASILQEQNVEPSNPLERTFFIVLVLSLRDASCAFDSCCLET